MIVRRLEVRVRGTPAENQVIVRCCIVVSGGGGGGGGEGGVGEERYACRESDDRQDQPDHCISHYHHGCQV